MTTRPLPAHVLQHVPATRTMYETLIALVVAAVLLFVGKACRVCHCTLTDTGCAECTACCFLFVWRVCTHICLPTYPCHLLWNSINRWTWTTPRARLVQWPRNCRVWCCPTLLSLDAACGAALPFSLLNSSFSTPSCRQQGLPYLSLHAWLPSCSTPSCRQQGWIPRL